MTQFIEDVLPPIQSAGLNTAENVLFTGDNTFSGTNAITSATFASTSTFTGRIAISTQTVTGGGALSTTLGISLLDTTGGGAFTLANGGNGQIKFISMVVDSGTDAVITPATKTGFSTITMGDVGDSVTLIYVTTYGWMVVGNNGCTLA